MERDVIRHLLEQLTFHFEWEGGARARLADLTDDELFWEPVEGMWSIRPRAEARTALVGGSGDLVAEFAFPEPDPTPMTTIAWRLAHVVVGVFGMRNAAHFGGPPMSYESFDYPGTAKEWLALLDEGYERWVAGVRSMDEDRLWSPVGEAEGPHAHQPYVDLVLHIHREAIHHLAEVSLLRDLYRWRQP